MEFLLVKATAYRAPNPTVSARAMAIGAMLLSNPSERFVFSILALVWNELMAWRQKMMDIANRVNPMRRSPLLSTDGVESVNELRPNSPVATDPNVTEVCNHLRNVRCVFWGGVRKSMRGGRTTTHLVCKVNLGINLSHVCGEKAGVILLLCHKDASKNKQDRNYNNMRIASNRRWFCAAPAIKCILPPRGLWVVAVPIGNLADITQRAQYALTHADLILCEDTRRTAQLLSLLGVESFMPRLNRFDTHSRDAERWINQLNLGRTICLVSDAGTPAISDPGALLVEQATKRGIPVAPIPGASAITALLSVCGFKETAFTFRGFYPRKETEHAVEVQMMRQAVLLQCSSTFVYFDSPLRIAKTLQRIATSFPSLEPLLIVAKELTKLHEHVFRGNTCEEVSKAVEHNLQETGEVGEWCFAVHFPRSATTESNTVSTEHWSKTLQCLLRANVSVSESTKLVCEAFPQVNKKDVYREALRVKETL